MSYVPMTPAHSVRMSSQSCAVFRRIVDAPGERACRRVALHQTVFVAEQGLPPAVLSFVVMILSQAYLWEPA